MRYLSLASLPLAFAACAEQEIAGSGGQRDGWGNGLVWTEPGAQHLDPAPWLNASGEHRAIVLRFAGEAYYLFNGHGEIVLTYCDRSSTVFTRNRAGFVTAALKCTTTNTTGKAVVFTRDDNPVGSLCTVGEDPEGNPFQLCNWREVISASGQLSFKTWGTPVYP